MYPNVIFLGMTLYDIFLLIGVMFALVLFRLVSDKERLSAAYQNLVIVCGVFAIIFGYAGAVLFQAFYNFLESGFFEITNSTGATFYGGLIFGVVSFLIGYFIVGNLIFKDRYHVNRFLSLSAIASVSISGAHGFGRIGCLFAGCCYGRPTDSAIGVYNHYLGCKVVPVQLFEAIFLFALSAILLFIYSKGVRNGLSVYFVSYGIWRFLIEFLRDDQRGASLVDFLSPSQLIALILVTVGVFGLIFSKRLDALLRGEKYGK